MLRHELFHVTHRHSLDAVILEMLSVVFWFNPFLFFIRRELRAIHEYAADAEAARVTDTYSYARLLLIQASGRPVPLTHCFFTHQIKRRINMITNPRKNKRNWMGRLMILPLLAALIALFSFNLPHAFEKHEGRTIRVVIDAGHGGRFSGGSWNGILEKNINLDIAKKIQVLAPQYNVSVTMTRETDITPGSNDLRESLEYIAAMPKTDRADLFVSIHTNLSPDAGQSTQDGRTGFEIYIPRRSSDVFENSRKLGSVLTDEIKSDYPIESTLKQIPPDGGNILVLKKASVPAVLIECGYMDNKNDLAYLRDEKNQEKIARDILQGIRKYADQNRVFAQPRGGEPSGLSSSQDTLTYEEMSKINPRNIDSIAVSRKDNLIRLTLKDGKKYLVIINDAYLKSADSSRRVQDSLDRPHPMSRNSADTVYQKVEIEAVYPGGQKGWIDYLVKNLKYPDAAISKEIQGQVIVEFVVKTDGRLSDIHVLSGPALLRDESLRIIQESGPWIPAKNNGKNVDSYHRQPINYKLQSK